MRCRFWVAVLFLIAVLVTTGVNAQALKPLLRMEFAVQENSLNEVMEILQRYAKSEGFRIDDIGPRLPPKDNRVVFYAILTRAA